MREDNRLLEIVSLAMNSEETEIQETAIYTLACAVEKDGRSCYTHL